MAGADSPQRVSRETTGIVMPRQLIVTADDGDEEPVTADVRGLAVPGGGGASLRVRF